MLLQSQPTGTIVAQNLSARDFFNTLGYKQTLRPCRRYVRLTPRSRHSSANVPLLTKFVCFTPRSRPSRCCRRRSEGDPTRKSLESIAHWELPVHQVADLVANLAQRGASDWRILISTFWCHNFGSLQRQRGRQTTIARATKLVYLKGCLRNQGRFATRSALPLGADIPAPMSPY